MKNSINKIFFDETDEEVHEEFVKFSRGVFDNRYLLEGKKQKDKWSIKTSSEFVNYFVKIGLEKIEGNVNISGVIVSTGELKRDIDFPIERIKNFQGIKQIIINTEVDKNKILALMDKYPKAFFALSFKTGDYELKTKAKAPKNGKPGKKDEDGPKVNFCSLKTLDVQLIRDLFFDFPDFNVIKIRHEINIKEIEIPLGVKDPKEMREKAIRKGVLKRFVEVDGKKEIKEKEFSI